ncbi:MAG: mycofactocin biosynthesis chaperone MftB [Ilumatobacteraceae bacterium]
MSTDIAPAGLLHRALGLHPQVALRPEPFGALAYHYGTRRLVFLKHPDMVAVAQSLAGHETLSSALRAAGISETRWPSFERAFASLVASGVVHER